MESRPEQLPGPRIRRMWQTERATRRPQDEKAATRAARRGFDETKMNSARVLTASPELIQSGGLSLW